MKNQKILGVSENVLEKLPEDIQELVEKDVRIIEAGILTDEGLRFYCDRNCIIETLCTAGIRKQFSGFDLIGWLLTGLFIFRSKLDPQHLKIVRVAPKNKILNEEDRFLK